MNDYHTNALNDALECLADSPILPAAVRYLTAKAGEIDAQLRATVVADIPAFSASGNPDILPELAEHGPRHTQEILRLLGGGAVGNFDFVRAHAARRAEQHFPLEATLHAYRCGHKVFSRWLREAASAAVSSPEDAETVVAEVADFTLEYTDAISTIAAGTYVTQTRLLADVAGNRRAELLTVLLNGYDESDGRVANILRDAGYLDRRQSFCIALAQPINPKEMTNPDRARRLAESLDRLLRDFAARRLIDSRDNRVTIVLSHPRRASGWTEPNVALANRVAAELSMAGNSVLIGVSNDVPSTAQIPNAYREAQLALELADVTQRVVQVSRVPTLRLLVHLAGSELRRYVPAWSHAFNLADDKSGGVLSATLRAYADADMNVLKAAQSLTVHPNTIYARLQKIADMTSLDARSYHALTELLIVTNRGRLGGG